MLITFSLFLYTLALISAYNGFGFIAIGAGVGATMIAMMLWTPWKM